MKCMDCLGLGVSAGVHGGIKCFRCQGSGVVSDKMPVWQAHGRLLAMKRKEMGVSLFEFAQANRLDSAFISSIEGGRVDNLSFDYDGINLMTLEKPYSYAILGGDHGAS